MYMQPYLIYFVLSTDVKLMICRLDCSKQKHYHCPKCGLVVGNTTKKQNGITKHLQLCTGEAGKLLDDLVNMETDHADVQVHCDFTVLSFDFFS